MKIRTEKPEKGNKNYITVENGGWNTCIKGSPEDKDCDVLSNCVGYSAGRYHEIINEARGTEGFAYKALNCNAEEFLRRAYDLGLDIGTFPKRGAIMCWSKGKTQNSADGSGHVAIVETINKDRTLLTSESGYNKDPFWTQTRNNKDGNWNMGKEYDFLGFIYLPRDVQEVVDGKIRKAEESLKDKIERLWKSFIEKIKRFINKLGVRLW